MATKPTDPIAWAESGVATDPAAKRTNGWLDNDTLPAANANFLWRALGRVGTFALSAFNSNGWLTLDTAEGRLEVTSDSGALHRLDHLPTTSAACVIRADQVHSRSAMRVGVVTGAADEGAVIEQISGLANARSVQVRGEGTVAGGMNTGAILVGFNDAPNADFLTMHPRPSSLYARNLIKMQAICNFEWDAAGAISVTGIGATSFNVATVALNTATTPDQYELTLQEDFTPVCLQVSIVDGSISSPQFSAALVTIPGSPDKIGVRLYFFGGGGWNDAFQTNITLANVTVRVAVLAI